MKILFLCGSLELGRDGVGDYTRRIACELARQGHLVTIISLNEKENNSSSVEEKQQSEGTFIWVLRLSIALKSSKRFALAKEKIESFDPDMISLQYVLFSFSKKGLPFRFTKKLLRIGNGRKWQVTFHELWLGIDAESGIKQKIIGLIQKKIISNMLNKISPEKILVHSQIYKHELSRLGYSPTAISLISNIPFVQKEPKKAIVPAIGNDLNFSVFGYIQPKNSFHFFAASLSAYARAANKKIHFGFIGNNGTELANWVSICEEHGFATTIFGEKSPEYLSSIITTSDFGVSSTPYIQIEKSGSTAAFRAYSIPVICVGRAWTPKKDFKYSVPPGIFPFDNEFKIENLLHSKKIKSRVPDIEAFGRSFLNTQLISL